MLKYTIMRLIEALVVSIALTLVVFLLMHAVPGDPAAVIAGHTATPDEIAAVRAELGLDKPLPEQYVAYLSRLAHGEIGYSYSVQRDVTDQFTTAIWITLQLSLGGLLLSALIGIAFGILTGYYRNTIIDYIGISLAVICVSMPIFWFGLLAMQVFAIQLRILPAAGYGHPNQLILPIVTLSLSSTALFARMARSSLIEVMMQDYVRTARGKGLREKTVVFGHALRNSFIPLVTLIGLRFGALLGGAVITETVFSVPGLGRMLVSAVIQRDIPIVQTGVLLIGLAVVLVNFLVDLSYGFLDPRISTTY